MPQYLVKPENIKADKFLIDDEDEVKHVSFSVRAKIGDAVFLFDGAGARYEGTIEKIDRNFISGSIIKKIKTRAAKAEIILCFAPVSKNAVETVLDGATQLGVKQFIPVITARTENFIPARWAEKQKRRLEIMLNACRQCMRADIPKISAPVNFKDAFDDVPSFIAHPAGTTALGGSNNTSRLKIFVGPEGGFTKDEIDFAVSKDAKPFSLGDNILRAETAAIYAVARFLQ